MVCPGERDVLSNYNSWAYPTVSAEAVQREDTDPNQQLESHVGFHE